MPDAHSSHLNARPKSEYTPVPHRPHGSGWLAERAADGGLSPVVGVMLARARRSLPALVAMVRRGVLPARLARRRRRRGAPARGNLSTHRRTRA